MGAIVVALDPSLAVVIVHGKSEPTNHSVAGTIRVRRVEEALTVTGGRCTIRVGDRYTH